MGAIRDPARNGWKVASLAGPSVRRRLRPRLEPAPCLSRRRCPVLPDAAVHLTTLRNSKPRGQGIAHGRPPAASPAMIRNAGSPQRASRRWAWTRRSVSTAINGIRNPHGSVRGGQAMRMPREGRGCPDRQLSDRGERRVSGAAAHPARVGDHPQPLRSANACLPGVTLGSNEDFVVDFDCRLHRANHPCRMICERHGMRASRILLAAGRKRHRVCRLADMPI